MPHLSLIYLWFLVTMFVQHVKIYYFSIKTTDYLVWGPHSAELHAHHPAIIECYFCSVILIDDGPVVQ